MTDTTTKLDTMYVVPLTDSNRQFFLTILAFAETEIPTDVTHIVWSPAGYVFWTEEEWQQIRDAASKTYTLLVPQFMMLTHYAFEFDPSELD